jgi:NACHT domain- and WD repeat-containing protein
VKICYRYHFASPNACTSVSEYKVTVQANDEELIAGTFVRAIHRWNGVCSANGQLGLYAPDRGGLEVLDLKTGNTVHCLIPRIAEGVFSTISLFTGNDMHVVYYHSGRRSIRVFRVTDGKQIADYKV